MLRGLPGDRKTSLRGGFGIYYEHPSLYHARTTMQELPPFTQVGSVNQTDLTPRGIALRFPDAYSTQLDLLSAAVNIRSLMYNMDTMYGYRWNAMVQRELPGKWVASVGYTGSQYHNLLIQSIGHITKLAGLPRSAGGRSKILPGRRGPRQSRRGLTCGFSTRVARPTYDGLTVGLQKRLSHGLDMQVSYTYSRPTTRARACRAVATTSSQGQRTVQGFWDLYLDYGLSSFDIRNNFTANFTYQLPGDNLTGFVGAAGKGLARQRHPDGGGWIPAVGQRRRRPRRQSHRECATACAPTSCPEGTTTPCWAVPIMYFDPDPVLAGHSGLFRHGGRAIR